MLLRIRTIFLFFAFLLSAPIYAEAATLYFSPSSGTYKVGGTISVSVLVSSTDKAMNAVSTKVSFPSDKFSVSSISKTNSVINFWVQEPSYSNSDGSVSLEGVVLNPGYIGSSGKIATITFKVKDSGSAKLSLSSSSVLANDGVGTDILSSIGSASFVLEDSSASVEEAVVAAPPSNNGNLSALVITSATHPDQSAWYNKKNAQFAWGLPDGASGVKLLYDHSPNSRPTVLYSPAISSKEVTNLSDGVWYFHAAARDQDGDGSAGHYKFQIDTERPNIFDINEVETGIFGNPRAKFLLTAEDKTSGIDHYEIQVDTGKSVLFKDDGSHTYETEGLPPGDHTIFGKVFDRAGNFATARADFTVSALNPPKIISYTKEVRAGDVEVVRATTEYRDVTGVLVIAGESNDDPLAQMEARVGIDGSLLFALPIKLEKGDYRMWVKARSDAGGQSDKSEIAKITVKEGFWWMFGSTAITVLSMLVPITALVILLATLLWYARRRYLVLRRRVRAEALEAGQSLRKAFKLLREDIEESIDTIRKAGAERKLTKEEATLFRRLRKAYDDSERFIGKEIRDIEELE